MTTTTTSDLDRFRAEQDDLARLRALRVPAGTGAYLAALNGPALWAGIQRRV